MGQPAGGAGCPAGWLAEMRAVVNLDMFCALREECVNLVEAVEFDGILYCAPDVLELGRMVAQHVARGGDAELEADLAAAVLPPPSDASGSSAESEEEYDEDRVYAVWHACCAALDVEVAF